MKKMRKKNTTKLGQATQKSHPSTANTTASAQHFTQDTPLPLPTGGEADYPMELFSLLGKPKTTKHIPRSNGCVIYVRVSTREQAENNTSLEVQRRVCEQYAQKYQLEIADYFGGTYESAKTDERKEFMRMLEFVRRRKGKISFILVSSLDRFSRSGANAIYITSELEKQGVQVVPVTQPISLDTPVGKLQQNMLHSINEFENSLRRDKCVAGMQEKLRRGYWIGKAPIGYDMYRKNSEQVVAPNKQGKLLALAFKWKAQEELTSAEISVRLRAMGFRITAKRLSDIFRNPFYCGIIKNELLPGELTRGKHQPIISQELFLRVNNVLQKNHQHYKHEKENDNLPLKRFIKCAKCGTSYAGYLVKKKNIHYYKCNKAGCRCNRNAQQMHELFKQLLSHYQVDQRFMAPLKAQLQLTFEKLNQSNMEHEQSLQAGIESLDKKIDKLQRKYVEEEIDRELYQKFLAEYKQEKQQYEQELAKVDKNLSNLSEYVEKSVEIAAKLQNLWEKGDYKLKEKVQYLVFPEGIYYERENHCYRTHRTNVIFSLIRSLSETDEGIKKGQTGESADLSASVVLTGLELYL